MSESSLGGGDIGTPRENPPENQSMILRMFLGDIPNQKLNEPKIPIEESLINKKFFMDQFKTNPPDYPTILETLQANQRADEFIIAELRDFLRPESSSPTQLPIYKGGFRSSTGLRVNTFTHYDDQPRVLTVDGHTVLSLHDTYTSIDFMPEGRQSRDSAKITQSLADGIDGMVELLDAIDHGQVEVAPVFVGNTNINMALIAQRLGFEITDQCRTENGEIDRNRETFIVIGRLDQIKKRVKQFKQSAKYDRLQTRAGKLRSATGKPELVPSG